MCRFSSAPTEGGHVARGTAVVLALGSGVGHAIRSTCVGCAAFAACSGNMKYGMVSYLGVVFLRDAWHVRHVSPPSFVAQFVLGGMCNVEGMACAGMCGSPGQKKDQ